MTTQSQTQPTASRFSLSVGSIDANWEDGRQKQVSAGGNATILGTGVSFDITRWDNRSNDLTSTSSALIQPGNGPGGVMKQLRTRGGNPEVDQWFNSTEKGFGSGTWMLGETRAIRLGYAVSTGTQANLGGSILGNKLGLTVGPHQDIEGETRLSATRLPGNQIQYALTQGYDVRKGFEFGGEAFGFKAGDKRNSVGAREGITFTFDLDTPEGRAANQAFLQSGVLPKPGAPGMSNYREQRAYEEKDPQGNVVRSLTSDYNPLTRVTSVHETIAGSPARGNASLEIDRKFIGTPPNIREAVDKREYSLTFRVTSANIDALKALDLTGAGIDGRVLDKVQPPADLQLRLNEAQMQALMRTSAQAERNIDQARRGNVLQAPGYNADDLMASNLNAGDKTLVFAQLVASGRSYSAGMTPDSLRASSNPPPRSNDTALDILAQTTDAANVRPGANATSGSLLQDGNGEPVHVSQMRVAR